MTYKTLICDTAATGRLMACDALKDTRFSVIAEVSNGRDAIESFRLHRPDLVILSLTLPDMDGSEVREEILAIDEEAIVIIQFAMGQDSRARACLGIGRAKGSVCKPYTPARLLKVLDEIFD